MTAKVYGRILRRSARTAKEPWYKVEYEVYEFEPFVGGVTLVDKGTEKMSPEQYDALKEGTAYTWDGTNWRIHRTITYAQPDYIMEYFLMSKYYTGRAEVRPEHPWLPPKAHSHKIVF